MGTSSAYVSDTTRSFGSILNHDDNLGEAQLSTAFQRTKAEFERRFPEYGPYNSPPTQARQILMFCDSWVLGRRISNLKAMRLVADAGKAPGFSLQ